MNRGVDLLITYRIVKLLATPFNKQEAFKLGIIDEKGTVLRKYRTLQKSSEKRAYTMLHRFVFNLKRILAKAGIRGALGSFAVAAALLFKENKEAKKHQLVIESAVITYLKQIDQYNSMISEDINIPDIQETPVMNCFGVDVFEKDGELISEYEYDKTL
nr:hypothetical protein [uncultured Mediterranean phage uvMED]|tara:strand:- start:14200 stop:14676 length:477 start_codon:yes stop_codon:yes gene_type:complete